jgi:hypothetical protein
VLKHSEPLTDSPTLCEVRQMADGNSTATYPIITQRDALALGLTRYFTGSPCRYGHICQRHTSNTCCVECRRASNRHFYKRHREKCVARNQAWRKDNPERAREVGRRYRANNLEKAREAGRRCAKKYRAKNLVYQRRVAGLPEPTRPCPDTCECCGRGKGKRAFSLDHDHRTGAFRGWLCAACNLGLGKLGDTIASVSTALEYLRRAGLS